MRNVLFLYLNVLLEIQPIQFVLKAAGINRILNLLDNDLFFKTA